jgi:dTDP-glucose pyrophosphorylase
MDKTKLELLLVSPDINIKQAIQKLNETGEKILFVVDNCNNLLGTIADGDVRRGIIRGMELSSSVQPIVQEDYVSVNENCSDFKEKARELMKQYVIEQIPVVNSDGKITDVILWTEFLDSGKIVTKKQRPLLNNSVVIMAGGKGARLDPFTKILPKPLIPFNEKPIIEHIMDRFSQSGFSRFIVIVNYKKEMIKMYFSDNNKPYIIEYVEENDFCGTAGGLHLLKNKLNDTFVVTNCDTILEGDLVDFFKWHKERKHMMTIVGSHKEITLPYGVLKMTDDKFAGIEEKPKYDLFVNTGTYIFEPRILSYIGENEHINMDQLICKVISGNCDNVGIYPHWRGWLDLGQWDEYRKSLVELEKGIDGSINR